MVQATGSNERTGGNEHAICDGASPLPSFEEGLQVQRGLASIEESAVAGPPPSGYRVRTMADFAKIGSCDALTRGTAIEARRGDVVHFAGRVSETMPDFGLFWAVSESGERRIVMLDEYEVYAQSIPGRD